MPKLIKQLNKSLILELTFCTGQTCFRRHLHKGEVKNYHMGSAARKFSYIINVYTGDLFTGYPKVNGVMLKRFQILCLRETSSTSPLTESKFVYLTATKLSQFLSWFTMRAIIIFSICSVIHEKIGTSQNEKMMRKDRKSTLVNFKSKLRIMHLLHSSSHFHVNLMLLRDIWHVNKTKSVSNIVPITFWRGIFLSMQAPFTLCEFALLNCKSL